MLAQPLSALDGDTVAAYRRLEHEIETLGAVWPPARPALRTVLACYEDALSCGSATAAPAAWAEFVGAVERLRSQTAHLLPLHTRRRTTRRALHALDAIVRENDDLLVDRL